MKSIRHLLVTLGLCAVAVQAQGQVTSLTMNSEQGDYIGLGQFLFFSSADGPFIAQVNYDQGISISFMNADHFWYLDFAAAGNVPLMVGPYSGATRFPFQAPTEPGLSVAGDGRGCNTLTGNFEVLEISYDGSGNVASFDAIFEQHCEGLPPALRGEIRYNAHPVVAVNAPANLTAIENQNVHFTVSATDSLNRHVVLTATGIPPGATFVDNNDNTGTFDWTPTTGQAAKYLVTFNGDNLSGNLGATYTQITVTAPPAANDDFDNATVVGSLPFTATEDPSSATGAADDPFDCYGSNQSVWFVFTATTDLPIEANTFGSSYDSTLSVYTGSRGSLNQLSCNDDSNGTVQSRVRFQAAAGTTYYFKVSTLGFVSAPATLVFNVLQGPPPLSVAVVVNQFGTVTAKNGSATVSGSINSSKPAYVQINGELKQIRSGQPIDGFFSIFQVCPGGTTAWSTTVDTIPALFHGRSALLFSAGKATLSAHLSAFDPDSGENIERDISVPITLRGKGGR